MKIEFVLFGVVLLGGDGVSYAHEYPRPIQGYYSQKGQDKFLNETIFRNKNNGVFIEIGAHDGISFSNTYFFEKYRGWTGICVEPHPNIFSQLVRNRTCFCESVCISDTQCQKEFLKCTGYMLEMYSGLTDKYDQRHLERIKKEVAVYGGDVETIMISCITFHDLIKQYNISYIDLLSIDVEGGEKAIITTINFDKVTIKVIVVENNFNEDDIKEYLMLHGYKLLKHIGKDDIYLLKKDWSDE